MSNLNNEIVAELERIASKSGGILKPDDVVNAAENPESPLHSKFQWDDSVAAHEYRIYQARNLIRVVVNIVPKTDQTERIWVSLKQDQQVTGGGYRQLVSVLSDADLRGKLLEQAVEDLNIFREKYLHLKELSLIFIEIENLNKKKKKPGSHGEDNRKVWNSRSGKIENRTG